MPFKDKDKERAWWEARRTKIRQHVDEAKNGPCTDCGGRFPAVAMQFDHVAGDKRYNIADATSRATSIANLEQEIAKCELVCANCHAVRTHERMTGRWRKRGT